MTRLAGPIRGGINRAREFTFPRAINNHVADAVVYGRVSFQGRRAYISDSTTIHGDVRAHGSLLDVAQSTIDGRVKAEGCVVATCATMQDVQAARFTGVNVTIRGALLCESSAVVRHGEIRNAMSCAAESVTVEQSTIKGSLTLKEPAWIDIQSADWGCLRFDISIPGLRQAIFPIKMVLWAVVGRWFGMPKPEWRPRIVLRDTLVEGGIHCAGFLKGHVVLQGTSEVRGVLENAVVVPDKRHPAG